MCEYCENSKRTNATKDLDISKRFDLRVIPEYKSIWLISKKTRIRSRNMIGTHPINYCPMCGRKLEEKQDE